MGPGVLRAFFFFQAEDGIRDADVTGVQTCALPISAAACALLPPVLGLGEGAAGLADRLARECGFPVVELLALPQSAPGQRLASGLRSEERRVGNGRRSRWRPESADEADSEVGGGLV